MNIHKIEREYVPVEYIRISKRRQMLRNNFKFMFVRHPYERLVSAWRNKFALRPPNMRYVFKTSCCEIN